MIDKQQQATLADNPPSQICKMETPASGCCDVGLLDSAGDFLQSKKLGSDAGRPSAAKLCTAILPPYGIQCLVYALLQNDSTAEGHFDLADAID
jgi:hypothetical protein